MESRHSTKGRMGSQAISKRCARRGVVSRRRRGCALNDHQVRLGRLESHGQQRRVLGGVVPATSTLHVGELQQYDALGLPIALPYLEFPTSRGEATTVLLDGGRNQLAVFRQSGLVMHIDIDDHIG